MIAILHEHYIIHALASTFSVVCRRTIYLPPTVTSQFSTLTCGLVKSTASMAEDAILFHANHIDFSFLSLQSERVEHTSTCASEASASTCNNTNIAVYILIRVAPLESGSYSGVLQCMSL